MNSTKTQQIYNIISYIKHSGITFTCRDVLENLQYILDKAGILSKFTDNELQIIKENLLQIATEKAVQDISYLLQHHPDPVLNAIALHSQLEIVSVQTKRR